MPASEAPALSRAAPAADTADSPEDICWLSAVLRSDKSRTFPAPEQRLIFGSSLGAYGAVDLAVEHPGVFGLCAAIAPPAQASTLLTNQTQGQRAIHGVRFFVLGAVYDTDVKGARTLRTALAEASADVKYEEVPEGHAAETFRTHIDNALKALLPAPIS